MAVGPGAVTVETELREVLEEASRSRGDVRASRIAELRRRPSAYRTSCPLHEVVVVLEDGSTRELVLKDLSPCALPADASRIRPAFLYDPAREIEVYGRLLARYAPPGTAACVGAVADPRRERYWLVLERVPGIELYQVSDLDIWRAVARWLATLHGSFAELREREDLEGLGRRARLLVHDPPSYAVWIARAQAMSPGPAAGTGAPERRAWNRLTRSYHRLVERLASLPTTFLHGEFYPSNILVGDSGSAAVRVCPVDWETAALGPALLDLAAYVSGSWTEAERASLIAAYRDALPGPEVATAGTSSERDFLETLDGCRLHVAVRWLGWSAGWSPPAAHVHDWFAEALSLGERLKLC